MSESLIEKLTKTTEGMRLYQQERAIEELTELICEIMQEQGVSRAELARRLGKTKGYITQLLDGRTNMTVRTVSDVLLAFGRTIHFQNGPLSATVSPAPTISLNTENWSTTAENWPAWAPATETSFTVQDKLAS